MSKIVDVIKYEGDNSTFIWKHPCEDFNSLSQLIVHESQEAIFFMNGQALDMFGPGRYTLETQNLPLVGKFLNRATDGESPFHCEVYFINKTEQMSIKWGTDSKIQYMDPENKFPLSIGASGEMSLRAEDSRKLLLKLVGTESYLNREKLTTYFRSFLMTRIKSYIARMIVEQKISIFKIDALLEQFSADIKNLLVNDFAEYGVALEKFFVTNILKPEGEPVYEKYKALHFIEFADIKEARIRQQKELIDQETAAQKIVMESAALATKRAQEGYTYHQERQFDVAEKVAQNEGVGEFTSLGIGFGAMAGVGGTVGGMVGGMMNNAVNNTMNQTPVAQTPATKFCDNCGAQINDDSAFCEECGTPVIVNKTCQNCGYEFERPGKFCPKCGTKREG